MSSGNSNGKSSAAGVIGYFDSPDAILSGMKKVKAANFKNFDAFTPFPVHGLEHAQGLKRSFLPWVTFFGGLTGLTIGMGFQYWTSAVDWPINVGGKPFFSWPAFVPVAYEVTVLLAGLSTVAAMLLVNGLPNLKKRTFSVSLTVDKFAIIIEADRGAQNGKYRPYSENDAIEVLKLAGASGVKAVTDSGWFEN